MQLNVLQCRQAFWKFPLLVWEHPTLKFDVKLSSKGCRGAHNSRKFLGTKVKTAEESRSYSGDKDQNRERRQKT